MRRLYCITMSKPNKWVELNGATGRGLMTKRRSAQAVGAWSRHQGAHSPGTKRPDLDDIEDIEEQEEDALADELEQMTNSIEASLRSLIEELEEEEDDREE